MHLHEILPLIRGCLPKPNLERKQMLRSKGGYIQFRVKTWPWSLNGPYWPLIENNNYLPFLGLSVQILNNTFSSPV